MIRFSQQNDNAGQVTGYHFKQLLVDDKVVWEEDVGGKKPKQQEVSVDVSRYAHGKANVNLTFRLFEKKPVYNFGVRWRFKDLQTEGLEPAADFRKPEKWLASHRGGLEAGFGEALRPGKSPVPYPVCCDDCWQC